MFDLIRDLYQRRAAKKMFARWSPIYEAEVTENAYSAADAVAKAALRHLQGRDAPRIADIGIGTGLLAQQMADALPSARIAGLDFSQDMMAACAGRGIAETLIPCDVGNDPWPLESGAYDAVLASGLFEYLTPAMAGHFLREAADSLICSGVLIFTYVPTAPDEKPIRFWRGHSGTYLVCTYPPEEIAVRVEAAGFQILDHSAAFAGCIFQDGSSYDYRLIVANRGD